MPARQGPQRPQAATDKAHTAGTPKASQPAAARMLSVAPSKATAGGDGSRPERSSHSKGETLARHHRTLPHAAECLRYPIAERRYDDTRTTLRSATQASRGPSQPVPPLGACTAVQARGGRVSPSTAVPLPLQAAAMPQAVTKNNSTKL